MRRVLLTALDVCRRMRGPFWVGTVVGSFFLTVGVVSLVEGKYGVGSFFSVIGGAGDFVAVLSVVLNTRKELAWQETCAADNRRRQDNGLRRADLAKFWGEDVLVEFWGMAPTAPMCLVYDSSGWGHRQDSIWTDPSDL